MMKPSAGQLVAPVPIEQDLEFPGLDAAEHLAQKHRLRGIEYVRVNPAPRNRRFAQIPITDVEICLGSALAENLIYEWPLVAGPGVIKNHAEGLEIRLGYSLFFSKLLHGAHDAGGIQSTAEQ